MSPEPTTTVSEPQRKRSRRSFRWAKYSDEQLLELRIGELGLRIDCPRLRPRINQLYEELTDRGIIFHPPCYLADEWFSPEGVPAIAIPFYLAHPRLEALEETMMMEVEGGTRKWCMQLLRHEAGHALDHAYRLSRKRSWRDVFGPPTQAYTGVYRPRVYSRNFVRHLPNDYAQNHPEDDFCETFAVWLNPRSGWRKQYRGWPVMKKLEYVDWLMRQVAGKPPRVTDGPRMCEARRSRMKLRTYYRRKRRQYEEEYPDFYDSGLRRIFADAEEAPEGERAAAFLRRYRREIVDAVSRWTGETKYAVYALFQGITQRAAELSLHRARAESLTALEVTGYLSSLVMNYRYTGKLKS